MDLSRTRAGSTRAVGDSRLGPLAVAPWLGLALLAAASCGETSGTLFYGEAGAPQPMSLSSWVPVVEATVDQETSPVAVTSAMLLDTGAPLVALSQAQHDWLEHGRARVNIGAFDLVFPAFPVGVMDLFSQPSTPRSACAEGPPGGIIGGDLLRFFELGLDYGGERLYLLADEQAAPPAALFTGTEPAQVVPLEVVGGGVVLEDQSQTAIRVPRTRLVVSAAEVEGQQVAALVDTGASLTVISQRALDALPERTRPHLCCEPVATIAATKRLPLTRLAELRLGPVSVRNLPAVVLDDDALFDALSRETGRDIQILVGGSFLRRFLVQAGYNSQTLELSRYLDQSHVPEDEYVGVGFTLCKGKAGLVEEQHPMVVLGVYEGTDADGKVQEGALLLAIDGTPLGAETTVGDVRDQLRQVGAGSTVKLTFAGQPTTITVEVAVENLLPDIQ